MQALGAKPKSGQGEEASKPKGRAPLKRADSTISKHRRSGQGGSTASEEMLKGLGLRDAPRAEGLSEALQGPPTQPPGEQLASLSQVTCGLWHSWQPLSSSISTLPSTLTPSYQNDTAFLKRLSWVLDACCQNQVDSR